MSGIEGIAAGVAARGVAAAARRLARTSEFDRLCQRLADRFAGLGWSEAQFAAWADEAAFMVALATCLEPPHKADREALVAAILPLVGMVDADRDETDFARELAVAIEEEMRFVKTGDSLIRAEADRAIQARDTGVVPRNAADALAQLDLVGDFLGKRDPYFAYPAITHESGGPAPALSPNAVLSVEQTAGGITSRIDAVPVADDAMARYGPTLLLRPTDDSKGEHAAHMLREAFCGSTAVEINEGLTVEFTRMPPAFAEVVGRPITGIVRVGPASPTSRHARTWKTRLRAKSDRGKASVDVDLSDSGPPPEGWDLQLAGDYGGMTVRVLVRTLGRGGEVHLRLEFARDDSPLAAQVGALRFLYATSGNGSVVISERANSSPALLVLETGTSDVSPDEPSTLAFLEDVLVLQEWTGVELDIPEEVDSDGVRAVARAAHLVRHRGCFINWTQWAATLLADRLTLLESGGVIRVTHTVTANVLGTELTLGRAAVEFTNYVVASAIASTEKDGYLDVLVRPRDGSDSRVFQNLFRGRVPTRLPRRAPPPLPRSRRRRPRGRARHRGQR